jgi:hypothetical protein
LPLPEVHRRLVDWLRREAVREQVLRELVDREGIALFRPLRN